MRYAVILLTVVLASSVAAGAAEDKPAILTVTVEGDITYSLDMRMAEFRDDVRILIQVAGRPEQQVIIRAQQGTVWMDAHEIRMDQQVTVGTLQGVLSGEHLYFNVQTGEFRLQQAQAAIALTTGETPPLHGYAFGEEIGRHREVIYVLRGKVTTCDRQNPHYALEAKRLEYSSQDHRFKIKGASVTLYGVRLPLIPSFSFKIGTGEEKPPLIPVPSYSSRDKLNVPYTFNFSAPDSPWQSDLTIRLTQKRGIRLMSANTYRHANWELAGLVSQTEDFYDDIGNYMILDRRPELVLTNFSTGPDRDEGWTSSLSLANIVEDFKDDESNPTPRPTIREQRAVLSLRYDRHADQHRTRQGRWYALTGRQAFYSAGDNYRDLALNAGVGGSLNKNLKGSLDLTHHITGGRTPFLSDTVNIRTELAPALDLKLSPRWSVDASGRYDANRGKLRDYELELSYLSHCLTWGLHYRFIGNSIGVRVYVNGLTGDTEPYQQHAPLDRLLKQNQAELAVAGSEE